MEQSGRNRWQALGRQKTVKRLELGPTVATGCHRPPFRSHGKEGVDGSSPSEGFRLSPAQRLFPLSCWARFGLFGVHRASTNVHRGRVELVEQPDRVLAAVAGEVAVVAVDHGQAGAHVAGELEGGDAGTQGEGRERVPEIVDAAEGLDPDRELSRLPVAISEVVQVEVAAAFGREEQLVSTTTDME
jgi:hypothetical protein